MNSSDLGVDVRIRVWWHCRGRVSPIPSYLLRWATLSLDCREEREMLWPALVDSRDDCLAASPRRDRRGAAAAAGHPRRA